ncbi:hypothetical protein [Hymenobacter canadensis]|uniref:T9SS type A sorting domain-containing protein n=1 Tax=Hymenobacter canadensis TaxID=2999067 RepID=A0ABY7LXG3_9BACT|nr:hypothetical protein [Hymenobacter canadensis]WBA43960.1 hypothetical protein O3303_20560 [Hymenobacter canadensis]
MVTSSSRTRYYLALALLVDLLLLGLVPAAWAQLPAYCSTSGVFQVTQSGGGNVTNGSRAVDSDFSNFATLTTAVLALNNPVGLRMQLTNEVPAGYRAGVVLANASGLLNINALGTVTLRTYLSTATPQLREEKVVRADLVRAALLAIDRPTQLEFSSSQSFDAVEIEIQSLVGLLYTTNIYYAYGVRPGVQTYATGYLSKFAAPTSAEYNTRDYTGLLCLFTDVDNPERVADFDPTNFATFRSVLTVGCQPSLRTKLANVPAGGVPAGSHAGFVVGQAGLLDVGVLSGLRLTTYLNGVQQQTKTGTGLLELTVLPGGRAHVSFPTTLPFDEVGIQRTGLITAVDNLNIYYGFGLQPQFFGGLNPVLTTFAAPTSPEQYLASPTQTLTVLLDVITLSKVDNPERAADVDVNNFALLNSTGTALLTFTPSLRLKLNGVGRAGNRVGMVIQFGAGLLNVAALERLTLLTYDANKDLVETKTGSALLNVSLLAGSTDRYRVSFLASRDFQYIALEATGVLSAFSSTRVYYAFAEDVPLLSQQSPLPVELTSFEAKWTGSATDLRWTTASEKNSSHFVVERLANGSTLYQPVGRLTAAGSSSRRRSYQLRDTEAGTLGVNLLYYRLRQVDVDGSETFSPVVAVAVGKLAGVAQLDVYPTPAGTAQEARLDFRNLPGGGQLTTYAENGQLVSQSQLAGNAGRVALPALGAGLYYVVLRDAAGRKVAAERLVVSGR